MTFWETAAWQQYEALCGELTPRAALLRGATWQTQVVDLAPDEAVLWRGVRKSYKALIHRHVGDVRHVDREVAADFVMTVAATLHAQKAGRVTRPPETWAMMGAWAAAGHADFFVSLSHSTVAGYVYILRHGAWAYYHSGVTAAPHIAHALVWAAMRWLKAQDVRWFELGWLARETDTPKDKAISFFKQGFGGTTMPAADAPALCGKAAACSAP